MMTLIYLFIDWLREIWSCTFFASHLGVFFGKFPETLRVEQALKKLKAGMRGSKLKTTKNEKSFLIIYILWEVSSQRFSML